MKAPKRQDSSRLELEHFQLDELHVEPRNTTAGGADGQRGVKVAVDFQFFTNAIDAHRFAVQLLVKAENSVTDKQGFGPYNIRVAVVGFFKLNDPLRTKALPQVLAVNGLTILYGIVRGLVSTASGWTNQNVLLPTVYFSPLVAERVEPTKRARAAAKEVGAVVDAKERATTS
jgi:preprotein translocase subunit SecB